jgi:hypothetical protein
MRKDFGIIILMCIMGGLWPCRMLRISRMSSRPLLIRGGLLFLMAIGGLDIRCLKCFIFIFHLHFFIFHLHFFIFYLHFSYTSFTLFLYTIYTYYLIKLFTHKRFLFIFTFFYKNLFLGRFYKIF